MVEFLKGWMTNLVTFIIIVTFLEIILPNGNMRRFVNMVIGIFLILVIINPFINLLKSNIDIEKEVFMNISEQSKYKPKEDEKFNDIRDKQVIDVYKSQIEKEIKNSLISKTQYTLEEFYIDIEENNENKEYGSIKKIKLIVSKNKEVKDKRQENNENIKIKDIKVDIKTKDKIENNENLDNRELGNEYSKDMEEITKNISKEFQIDQEKIFVSLKNKGTGGDESG